MRKPARLVYAMEFTASSEAIFEKSKDLIVTWFLVIARGRKAFEKLDLEKSSTLIYALRFMLFMAFVDLALNFPLIAKIDSSLARELAVPPVLIVESYTEYLVVGLILYSAMKLVGGKGSLQSGIAAYCLLTAYMPIVSFLMLPTRMVLIPAFLQGEENYINTVQRVAQQWSQLSLWDSASIAFSFVLTTIAFVLFFTAVFRQFRALHKLGAGRALFAFLGGLAASSLILAMFLDPPFTAILRAVAH